MKSKYGLIFDVDGVVADSETVNVQATGQAFAEILGIPSVRVEDFDAGIGRGAHDYVRAGAATHGRELTQEQVNAVVEARQENFLGILQREPLPAFPGVLELMEAALASPIFGLAIATSGTRQKSMAVLTSAGVPYDELEYICGDDVTHKKPAPELFSVACRRLQLPAQVCVVIEDAPNGIAAAHAAGCRCIAVPNTCTADKLAAADRIVDSLTEVNLEMLESLLSEG